MSYSKRLPFEEWASSNTPSVRRPQLFRVGFSIRALEPLDLADEPGPTLRGAFGRALFSLHCPYPEPRCDGCPSLESCSYGQLFETPRIRSESVLGDARFSTPPHPSWLRWGQDAAGYHAPGRILRFEILGIPRARRHLPSVAVAVARMCERGLGSARARCEVLACEDLVSGRLVRSAVDLLTSHLWSPPAAAGFAGIERIELELLSPLRLQRDGRLLERPTFADVAAAAGRRWRLLTHIAGEEEVPGRDLADNTSLPGLSAADFVQVERFRADRVAAERISGRNGQRQRFEGLLGRVAFRGNLAPFMPMLALGELAGIGKGVSLGFGRYQVTSLS